MNISEKSILECRADLYHALAEVLAEPPDWLALPGRDWPLTKAAKQLVRGSGVTNEAVISLAQIPAEPLSARRARYAALFAGRGRPRLWLYESMVRNGRFLGSESLAIEQLYQTCGLQTIGAELPDHASMELAFLAHLAQQQVIEPEKRDHWRQLEQQFIQKHAGCWLPEIGRSLACTNDTVYAPIGQLLTEWLTAAEHPSWHRNATTSTLPLIQQASACTLCGFCVQVCPTHALTVYETLAETSLRLTVSECIGCRKCVRICATHALTMGNSPDGRAANDDALLLRWSPRVCCPGCGTATISRAEMNFVINRIGNPAWLVYCLTCRAQLMENLS